MTRPYALSIAGFDPSGGAGLAADFKTFENCGVTGFGVCTALTVQTEDEFLGVRWLSIDEICAQLMPLLKRYPVRWLKVGLIENVQTLSAVLKEVKHVRADMGVVWDPILRASAGFEFHSRTNSSTYDEVLGQVSVVTPNAEEIGVLLGDVYEDEHVIRKRSTAAAIIIKGGHGGGAQSEDRLYVNGQLFKVSSERLAGRKHGSGCVFSAALTSFLANGISLAESFRQAHEYAHRFIGSAGGLLGEHSSGVLA